MKKRFVSLFICALFTCMPHAAGDIVHMVLEQDEKGEATHRAADLSPIGDGIDPVLQFILFETPADPAIAQVLWQASETPILWQRTVEQKQYRFVEYAVLPQGGRLEYHISRHQDGAELTSLSHTRFSGDQNYGLDASIIDGLPNSQYVVEAHLIVADRPVQIMKQRLDVVDFAPVPGDGQDPEPEQTPTLEPGEGWEGNIDVPVRVGDPKHPGYALTAIARWAVVPHQVFDGEFTVGVAAFHGYGIDHVAFSVENGPWINVDEMKINPRTGAKEYFVKLDAGRFTDGKVVLRAIAYPEHGQPRLLEDLELFANSSGSVRFPVIELGAGKHRLTGLSDRVPDSGWLTIRPKPGVAKEDCVITGIDRVLTEGHLKVQGVTMTHDGGNDFLYGKETGKGWVWLDDVKVVGNGRNNATSWLVHLWGKQIYTNCDISKVRSVFHGGGGNLFARNVDIHDTYEDVFRAFGYVANVTIVGVDRGDTNWHPDLFEFSDRWTQSQVIFHNVTARQAHAQGIFGGNMKHVAMVDCDVVTPGWNAMQASKSLKNVVFQNTRLHGGARFRDADPDGVVIRNSLIGWRDPFLPEGWKHPGVTVLEHSIDLDEE